MTPLLSQGPIVYTLRFPAPETHYIEVEALVPAEGHAQRDLVMAVWTPGSYLVREYSRHLEDVRADAPDGRPLAIRKTAKNRWRVTTAGAESVRVRYRVYGREMTVRTNFVDAEFALVNGAATCLTLADAAVVRQHVVRLELPAGWGRAVSALPEGAATGEFVAPDFDTLVDSPILAGTPAVYALPVEGTPHLLVNVGEDGLWDGPRSSRDLAAIAGVQARFWGSVPYDRYVFLNLLVETSGGIEHASSTVLMASRWATRSRRGYLEWLNLASHELFHAWNGKRLRPAALGPFDYERENHTTSLWVVEGLTEYYGDLMVRRAGLCTHAEYLDCLSGQISALQGAPGRFVQSLALSSFDAWIKHYRPDENSRNAAVSYYTKGAVVGFLLDVRIRRATGGERSLDDVMRAAFDRFAGARGYEDAEFRALVSEVAGEDVGDWLAKAVDGTEELDYAEALSWLGLGFKDHGAPEHGHGWLGAATRNDGGRLVVSHVVGGSPAHRAGLNVDDEVLGIDDVRVRPEGWHRRFEHYRPGEPVTLLVARRERFVRLDATLGAAPPSGWRLEPHPEASPTEHARLLQWLGDPSPFQGTAGC
jgi:predicted metalloprotease with PDZ domain